MECSPHREGGGAEELYIRQKYIYKKKNWLNLSGTKDELYFSNGKGLWKFAFLYILNFQNRDFVILYI